MPVRFRVTSPDAETFVEVSHLLSSTATSVLATSTRHKWHLVNGIISDKLSALLMEKNVDVEIL